MDEITLSEETIKTNEAKCLAAKREKEAVEAQLKASKKEEEARGSIETLLEVRRDNVKSIFYICPTLFCLVSTGNATQGGRDAATVAGAQE